MANIFRTIGRWFGFGQKVETTEETPLFEAVAMSTVEGGEESAQVGSELLELPPLESADNAGDGTGPEISATSQEMQAVEATGPAGETILNAETAQTPEQPVEPESAVGGYLSAIAPEAVSSTDHLPPVEEKAPIEMKPRPSVTFTQLYELIATEVSKRTDSAVGVYERMLGQTREELETTRRNNRIAWSVGGVMTAVAAFGGIWAASEVSATRVEVGALKNQLTVASQTVGERDQLRIELTRAKDSAAKIEIDALKARLDEALTVSAERDRMRNEVEAVKKVRMELEAELRLVKAATTQPVSVNKGVGPISATGEKPAMGSERPDVWSVLLNGKE